MAATKNAVTRSNARKPPRTRPAIGAETPRLIILVRQTDRPSGSRHLSLRRNREGPHRTRRTTSPLWLASIGSAWGDEILSDHAQKEFHPRKCFEKSIAVMLSGLAQSSDMANTFFTNKTRLLMYTLFAISHPQPLLSIFCSKFLRSSPLHDAPLDERQDLVPELVHLALPVELDDHHVVLVLRLVVLKVVVQVPRDLVHEAAPLRA